VAAHPRKSAATSIEPTSWRPVSIAPVISGNADGSQLKMKIGCVTKKGVKHLRAPVREFFEVARAKLGEIGGPDHPIAIR